MLRQAPMSYIAWALILILISINPGIATESLSVKGHPTTGGAAPKKLAVAIIKDLKDSVLTATVYNTEHIIAIDDKTIVTRKGKPAALSDLKTGIPVRITFIERSGRKVATVIDIRSDAK